MKMCSQSHVTETLAVAIFKGFQLKSKCSLKLVNARFSARGSGQRFSALMQFIDFGIKI